MTDSLEKVASGRRDMKDRNPHGWLDKLVIALVHLIIYIGVLISNHFWGSGQPVDSNVSSNLYMNNNQKKNRLVVGPQRRMNLYRDYDLSDPKFYLKIWRKCLIPQKWIYQGLIQKLIRIFTCQALARTNSRQYQNFRKNDLSKNEKWNSPLFFSFFLSHLISMNCDMYVSKKML